MIFLFTDFGWNGPYVGQMTAVLAAALAPGGVAPGGLAPGVPVIHLMHDAPAFAPRPAGHLLAALARSTLAALTPPPDGPVFLAVVDPGVGTARRPVAVRLGTTWLVGPDNGLLAPAVAAGLAAGRDVAAYEIVWRPPHLSASFHGRDLFAPVAARLALGRDIGAWGAPIDPTRLIGMGDAGPLAEIIHVDAYGNAWTGLPADDLDPAAVLMAGGRRLTAAATFGAVPAGGAFWYANSSGLVEIAVNQGRADHVLGLSIGTPVMVGG